MLHHTLQHLGYTEKESKIYLALLELGTSPVSTIARYLSENRVTTYSTIKLLVKKGLILASQKQGIGVYTSIHPSILIEQESAKMKSLESALPEMLSLMNTHNGKPKVTFYEGLDGLKNLVREVISDYQKNPSMDVYNFIGAKTMDKRMEDFIRTILEVDKIKPEITPTHIILFGNHDYWYANYLRSRYGAKTVEETPFTMEHEILAYKDTVVILMYTTDELSGIKIESVSLSSGLKSMFELIWKYVPDIY